MSSTIMPLFSCRDCARFSSCDLYIKLPLVFRVGCNQLQLRVEFQPRR